MCLFHFKYISQQNGTLGRELHSIAIHSTVDDERELTAWMARSHCISVDCPHSVRYAQSLQQRLLGSRSGRRLTVAVYLNECFAIIYCLTRSLAIVAPDNTINAGYLWEFVYVSYQWLCAILTWCAHDNCKRIPCLRRNYKIDVIRTSQIN